MKTKKQFIVKKDFGRDKVVRATTSVPEKYCLAICHPNKGQSFIVKGDYGRVNAYIIQMNRPLYVYLWFSDNPQKNCYQIFGLRSGYNAHILTHFVSVNNKCRKRIKLVVYDTKQEPISEDEEAFSKIMRQPPHSWPKELNPYVKEYCNSKEMKAVKQTFDLTMEIVQDIMA